MRNSPFATIGDVNVTVLAGASVLLVPSATTSPPLEIVGEPLTDVDVQLSSYVAGGETQVTLFFTVSNPIPFDGEIHIVFPSGTQFANSTTAESPGTDIDGLLTPDVGSPPRLVLTRSLSGVVPRGTVVDELVIAGVINRPHSGPFDVSVEIRNNGGVYVLSNATISSDTDLVPGPITAGSVTHADPTAGATSQVTVGFTVSNPWPADGSIDLEFPTGYVFNVGAATTATSTIVDGTITVDGSAPPLITLTRSGGSDVPAATVISDLVLSNVQSHPYAEAAVVDATTFLASGLAIDSGTIVGEETRAGNVTSLAVTLADASTFATTSVAFTWESQNGLPADGSIRVEFPTEFALGVASLAVSSATITGTFVASFDVASHSILLLRQNDGNVLAPGAPMDIDLVDVGVNPSAVQNTTFTLKTGTALGQAIDAGDVDGPVLTPADLNDIVVTLDTLVAGESNGELQFAFTTRTPVPSDARFVVDFPLGVDCCTTNFGVPAASSASGTLGIGGPARFRGRRRLVDGSRSPQRQRRGDQCRHGRRV